MFKPNSKNVIKSDSSHATTPREQQDVGIRHLRNVALRSQGAREVLWAESASERFETLKSLWSLAEAIVKDEKKWLRA